jgi:hypothetical protein
MPGFPSPHKGSAYATSVLALVVGPDRARQAEPSFTLSANDAGAPAQSAFWVHVALNTALPLLPGPEVADEPQADRARLPASTSPPARLLLTRATRTALSV